jgi:hypothetical protein
MVIRAKDAKPNFSLVSVILPGAAQLQAEPQVKSPSKIKRSLAALGVVTPCSPKLAIPNEYFPLRRTSL